MNREALYSATPSAGVYHIALRHVRQEMHLSQPPEAKQNINVVKNDCRTIRQKHCGTSKMLQVRYSYTFAR